MRVVVTGPTGAVGQYILEALMATCHEVRVLAKPDSMHRVLFRDRIAMIPGELSDPRAITEAVEGADIVFHAALVSPPPAMSPEHMMEVNAEGTRRLLQVCAGAVRRFVLCSSNNVYVPHRSPATWPLLDDAPREAHGNPQQVALGESLILAEDAVFEAAERAGSEYAVLRPTVIAGRKSPFIENMIRSIFRNPGTTEMQRRMWDTMQWSHGSDIARAALLVAEDPRARNECFLVAGDEPVTAYDIQAIMWEVINVGRPDNPYRDIASRNNIGVRKFEPRKLRALGWAPRIGIRQCVTEVLARFEFYTSAGIALPEQYIDV